MNDKQSSLQTEVIYEGSLAGVLWHLLVSIMTSHLGGLVAFIAYLLLTGQSWILGLIGFLFFVVFAWLMQVVFHSRRGS